MEQVSFNELGPFKVGITTARGLLPQVYNGVQFGDSEQISCSMIGVQDAETFGLRVLIDEGFLHTAAFQGSVTVDGDRVLDFCHILDGPPPNPVWDIPWGLLQSETGSLVTRELIFSKLENDVWDRAWRRKLRKPEIQDNIGVIEVRFSLSSNISEQVHISAYEPENEGKKVHMKDKPREKDWTRYTRLGRQQRLDLSAVRVYATQKLVHDGASENVFRIFYSSEGNQSIAINASTQADYDAEVFAQRVQQLEAERAARNAELEQAYAFDIAFSGMTNLDNSAAHNWQPGYQS
ncbi:MAG: hypothetical protein M1837_005512 [Sclerophora amabilis]|nr:MAG: hypothetical protein M1837_005512 [Sclerophora amabilis]